MIISKILSFDQATKTGWAFSEDCKLIKYGMIDLSEYKDMVEKSNKLKLEMIKLIYTYAPDIVAIEDIQFQKNFNVYKLLAEMKGVLQDALYEKGICYIVVGASQWKSTCKIKGRDRDTQKANAILFCKNTYGVEVSTDTADSICINHHVQKLMGKKNGR